MTDAPTPRLADELAGDSPWHTLEHHGAVTSTNELARRRARDGCRPGLIVVADRQTAGRGRHGRSWRDRGADRPGASLLVSFLVPAPTGAVSLVPLAAGLAVLGAVERVGAEASLKWPNDVLVATAGGTGKCAGVLVEQRVGVGTRRAHLVVGVGCNVDWRDLDPPPADRQPATSLAEATGRAVDRWALLADLAAGLPGRLAQVDGDTAGLRAAYADRCATLGERVEATVDGRRRVGRAAAIAPDGALVVATDGGRVSVRAGEVTAVRPAGPIRP